MWRGQQATSRGAMWEGRGSLVYPHIVHRVAPKMLSCVGRTTRHEGPSSPLVCTLVGSHDSMRCLRKPRAS